MEQYDSISWRAYDNITLTFLLYVQLQPRFFCKYNVTKYRSKSVTLLNNGIIIRPLNHAFSCFHWLSSTHVELGQYHLITSGAKQFGKRSQLSCRGLQNNDESEKVCGAKGVWWAAEARRSRTGRRGFTWIERWGLVKFLICLWHEFSYFACVLEFLAEAVYLSVDPYMRNFGKNLKLGSTFIGQQVAM